MLRRFSFGVDVPGHPADHRCLPPKECASCSDDVDIQWYMILIIYIFYFRHAALSPSCSCKNNATRAEYFCEPLPILSLSRLGSRAYSARPVPTTLSHDRFFSKLEWRLRGRWLQRNTSSSREGRWCEQAAQIPRGNFHPEPFTKGYSLMRALVLWIAVFTSLPLCCCAEGIKLVHHDSPQEISGGPEKRSHLDEDIRSPELFSPKWAKEYFNASTVVESNTVGCFPGRGSYIWTVSGLGSNINREPPSSLLNSNSRDGLYPYGSRLQAVSG